jgi:voltage-gated potassium channel
VHPLGGSGAARLPLAGNLPERTPMTEETTSTAIEHAATEAQHRERWQLLRSLDQMLEGPLIVLSFVWLAIMLIEFLVGTDARLDLVFYTIWFIFIVEVVIKLWIAPSRRAWLRGNWLQVASLAIPALRVLRVLHALRFLRAAQVVRSASMLRLITSVNRGIGAIGRTLDRARFAYVLAITLLVIVVGAAGMLFFEGTVAAEPVTGAASIDSYGEALWWAAMTMTTVGSEYAPVTAEGRLLAFILATYALGVFGYITATIASHFFGVGQDQPELVVADVADRGPGGQSDLAVEIAALRAQLTALTEQLGEARGSG